MTTTHPLYNKPCPCDQNIVSNCIPALCLLVYFLLSADSACAADRKHKSEAHRQQKRLKIHPITDYEDAWTANSETAVYRQGTLENITVGYSATHDWDFSLSLLNTPLAGGNTQFVGDVFLNIAKSFALDDDFSLLLGSQNGLALFNLQPQLWYNYTYLENQYDVAAWLSLHGGAYLANAALTGTSRQVGFITGAEITFIQNTLSLQMDYVSGHQALSGATVNLLLNVTPRCQMYLGVSVPERQSGNEFAGIVGFNLSTKNL